MKNTALNLIETVNVIITALTIIGEELNQVLSHLSLIRSAKEAFLMSGVELNPL